MKAELVTTGLDTRLNIIYDDSGREKLISLYFAEAPEDTYTLQCCGEFLTDIVNLINTGKIT